MVDDIVIRGGHLSDRCAEECFAADVGIHAARTEAAWKSHTPGREEITAHD